MAFEDKDNLMQGSISERYADLDEYIALHYVPEVADEECVYKAPRERKRHGGLFKSSCKAMSAESMAMREDSASPTMGAAPATNFMQAMAFADAALAPEPKPAKKLEDVIKNLDKSFMELVFTYADEKGITDVELQKKANINRKAFSKLKCGTTKNPSKPTALCFAIALELNLDETRDLLSRAGLALSPCSKQDIIVQYFIEHEAYDLYAVNEALFAHGEPTIGDVEE